MATTHPRTKVLKDIRRQIRNAIKWHKVDNGMPEFWSSENYKGARIVKNQKTEEYPYYCKSDKAIEKIAERILERTKKYFKE